MLSFVQLDKPHIDIELYGTDTNIAPIDKVHIMDEDSFEQFTLEWLFGCKKSKYSSIKRIGGAGDKGRDVVGYYSDGTVDYYQCKHYNTGLAPTNYYLELGKLCYYTYKKEIPIPKEYFIIASNDVGSSLQDLIDKPSDLLTSLIKNWDTYCKTKITKTKEVPLDKSLPNNEIESLIVRSKVEAVIFDKKYAEVFNKIKQEETSNLKYYICMDNLEDFTKYGDILNKGKKLLDLCITEQNVINKKNNSLENSKENKNEVKDSKLKSKLDGELNNVNKYLFSIRFFLCIFLIDNNWLFFFF